MGLEGLIFRNHRRYRGLRAAFWGVVGRLVSHRLNQRVGIVCFMPVTIATLLSVLLAAPTGAGHLVLEGPLEAVTAITIDGVGQFAIHPQPLLGLSTRSSLRGSLHGVPGGTLVVRRHHGHIAGRVLRPGRPPIAFHVAPGAALQWRMEDRSDQRPCLGVATDEALGDAANAPDGQAASSDPPPPPPQRDGAGDTGDIIDVLAVYTADALADAGSVDAMETSILSWFDASNIALDDSGITTQLRVVGMDEVTGSESGDLLEQLRLTSDGAFDEVHYLRNGLGADIVVLFVDSTDEDDNGFDDYCGIAYVITTIAGFPNYAFSVVKGSCADTGYTLVHEMGHLHGCAHDIDTVIETGGASGIYDHAYGWVFWGAGDTCEDDRYCTIMAYQGLDEMDDCPDPGDSSWIWTQRIGLFSTPDLDWDGTPVGDVDDADNVSVWNERCSVTAGYRTSVIPLNCPGDVDVSGEVDMVDLLALLTAWGTVTGGDDADINEDLEVGVLDLLVLLDGYGRCA